MPLTPYHFGPGLFIGLLFLSFIDFPTFLIASVIVDIEPFLVLLFNLNYPLHGFFHSFLGGTIIALILTVIMTKIREFFTPLMRFFKIEQEISFKKILFASLLGINIHILLDSPIYTDIRPFFPLDFNPFYRITSLAGSLETMICVWCFLAALIIYIIRLIIYTITNRRKNHSSDENNNLLQNQLSLKCKSPFSPKTFINGFFNLLCSVAWIFSMCNPSSYNNNIQRKSR